MCIRFNLIFNKFDLRNPFAIQNNIDKIIERALDGKKFEVYCQPIYSISSGRFMLFGGTLYLCMTESILSARSPCIHCATENTVKMLKDMKMEIVVEGIETQEMVDAFSDLKCDFIQGYFLHTSSNTNSPIL